MLASSDAQAALTDGFQMVPRGLGEEQLEHIGLGKQGQGLVYDATFLGCEEREMKAPIGPGLARHVQGTKVDSLGIRWKQDCDGQVRVSQAQVAWKWRVCKVRGREKRDRGKGEEEEGKEEERGGGAGGGTVNSTYFWYFCLAGRV
jgi:hypothetical protein